MKTMATHPAFGVLSALIFGFVCGSNQSHDDFDCKYKFLERLVQVENTNRDIRNMLSDQGVNMMSESCTPRCEAGYSEFSGSCYKAFDDLSATWIEAKMYCRTMGGDLTSIESEEEHKFLKKLLRAGRYRTNKFWLDGTDLRQEGKFQWMGKAGTPRRMDGYNGWSRNQPDNGSGTEHCMEMNGSVDYDLNDEQCYVRMGFICKF